MTLQLHESFGYITILGDTRIARDFYCDHGIAAQSILLAAVEQGLGGCIVGSIDRDALSRALALPDFLDILLVLALGTPRETVVIEDGTNPEPAPYWRDGDDVHHVPKRALEKVLVEV